MSFTGEVKTPEGSTLYKCSVTPSDHLVAYVTDVEHPPRDEFALVMTNAQEQKISVVLTKEDALRLREQLNTFIIRCAINRC